MLPAEAFLENLNRLWQEVGKITAPRDFVNFEGGGVEQQWDRRLLLHHCANYAAALTIFSIEKRNWRILELGCGSGTLSQAFARLMPEGWRLVATDYSPRLIEYARASYSSQKGFLPHLKQRLRFEQLNTKEISLPVLQEFDGVMLLEVIEHLSPRQVTDLLLRLHQGLNPGGMVVISTLDRSPFPRPFSGYVHHQIEYRYETLREFFSYRQNNPFEKFSIFRLVSPKIASKAVRQEARGGYFLNRLLGVWEKMSQRYTAFETIKKKVAGVFYPISISLFSQRGFNPDLYLKEVQLITTKPEERNRHSFSLVAVLRK